MLVMVMANILLFVIELTIEKSSRNLMPYSANKIIIFHCTYEYLFEAHAGFTSRQFNDSELRVNPMTLWVLYILADKTKTNETPLIPYFQIGTKLWELHHKSNRCSTVASANERGMQCYLRVHSCVHSRQPHVAHMPKQHSSQFVAESETNIQPHWRNEVIQIKHRNLSIVIFVSREKAYGDRVCNRSL